MQNSLEKWSPAVGFPQHSKLYLMLSCKNLPVARQVKFLTHVVARSPGEDPARPKQI